jgi:crotonobetainyl-CoA:carnitine CoA-transferase CaiB-like acyl-CoA transferase
MVDNGVIDIPKEQPVKAPPAPPKISRSQTEQLKELKALGFDITSAAKKLGIEAESTAKLTEDQAQALIDEAAKNGFNPTG